MPISKKDFAVYQFHMVANIPYGGIGDRSRENLIQNNRGSCSSKHALLSDMLYMAGIETKKYIGKCDLRRLNAFLPEQLQAKEEIFDFHNFLEIKTGLNWTLLDATFGVTEKAKGMPTNIGWDGNSDCNILFPVSERTIVDDIFSAKASAIADLSEDQQQKRQHFFAKLVAYLNEK